jgi:hypothetical protein
MPSRVGCTARATLELIIIAYLALGNRCPERSLAGLLRAYPILTLYLPCIYPILTLYLPYYTVGNLLCLDLM